MFKTLILLNTFLYGLRETNLKIHVFNLYCKNCFCFFLYLKSFLYLWTVPLPLIKFLEPPLKHIGYSIESIGVVQQTMKYSREQPKCNRWLFYESCTVYSVNRRGGQRFELHRFYRFQLALSFVLQYRFHLQYQIFQKFRLQNWFFSLVSVSNLDVRITVPYVFTNNLHA